MTYELKIFELLFFDRFNTDITIEGWTAEDVFFCEKDIREKLDLEIDKTIEYYFDIAFSEKTENEIKFFFKRRVSRLFSIKIRLEEILEETIHEVILFGKKSGSLVAYNNVLVAYEGVCKLLSLIYSDLSISFNKEEISKAEEFEVKYKKLEDETIAEWRSILREKIQTSDNIIEVDGMRIDISEDREFVIKNFSNDYSNSFEDDKEEVNQNARSFDDYMRGVRHIVNKYPENTNNEKKVIEKTNKIVLKIYESDSIQKEKELLDFLLETNIAPEETFYYIYKHIKLVLSEGVEFENIEYLNNFNSRLKRLKEEPKYQNLHRSNFVAETNNSISRLMLFIESELDGLKVKKNANVDELEPVQKIKTNLTVEQIALLFRLLVEEKDVKMESVRDISKRISASFSAKRQKDIGAKSLKNDFDQPTESAITFWKTKVVRLKQLLEKY